MGEVLYQRLQMFWRGHGQAYQCAVAACGGMQGQDFWVCHSPLVERFVRIHRDADKSLERIAQSAQIDPRSEPLDDGGLFQTSNPFGDGGRSEVHSTTNFRVAQARIFLQQSQNFPVIGVEFKIQGISFKNTSILRRSGLHFL